MCAGITPRFGKDIFDKLEKETMLEIRNNPLPGKTWTLTQEVHTPVVVFWVL